MGSYEIITYGDNVFNDIVKDIYDNSLNYNMFLDTRFLSYHDYNLNKHNAESRWHHIVIKKNNIPIVFVPGYLKKAQTSSAYLSPYGASIGGWCFVNDLNYYDFQCAFEVFLDYLKNICTDITITPPPDYYCQDKKINYFHYLLLKNNFEIIKSDIMMVHSVKEISETERLIHKTILRQIKHAIKFEPKFYIEDVIKSDVYEVLLESQKKFNKIPTHSFQELNEICRIMPGKVKAFYLRKDDVVLSGIICFILNDYLVTTFYIFDKEEYREHKPSQLNYYYFMKWASEKRFKFIDFGSSSFGYDPNIGLINFKEKFNSVPYLRQTYRLKKNKYEL